MSAILLIIIAVFLGKIIKKIVDKAKAKNAYYASTLSQSVQYYIKDVQTTASVSSFISSWQGIKRDTNALSSYRNKLLDNNVKCAIDEASRAVQNIDEDFQWMLCNVIDRMAKKAIKEIKTTYKYSKENKERVLLTFQNEIELGYSYFSEDTRELADEKLEEVSSLTETSLAPSRNRALQQRSIPSEASDRLTCLEDVDVDSMDGQSFERFCANLLRANGFNDVELTKGSGDQGVDILAIKDEIRYAIQCKCYSSDIGNTPVQEVYTGRKFYRCHIGVVMTNSYFTQGAIDAAKATGVLLWDRRKLFEFVERAKTY